MRLLIGYDGSESADLALSDLASSGVPDAAEALVVVVAEIWLNPPPPSTYAIVAAATTAQPANELLDMCASDSPLIKESEELAARAVTNIQGSFPKWNVRTEVCCGSPASEIIKQADAWQPDLIVVGSRGRTALGRLILGSVSQKLVNEACSSVRVARGRAQSSRTPLRLIVGVDGSRGAEQAVHSVAERRWPKGSEAKLLTSTAPFQKHWPSIAVSLENLEAMQKKAASELGAAGLSVSSEISELEPKRLLVEEAEAWDADCIFVGAKGHTLLERILIGSVSGAIAGRAHCSVEVVRGSEG